MDRTGGPDRSPTRIWRLRKRNLYVDAELRPAEGSAETELRVFYGTTLTWSGKYPNRDAAVADARERRAALEREGWTFHW